ncbi:MAG TPA: hypothetical protein DET40_11735 [Lentisphaeria bacterium]|nr:MAG: hypothetical protein A2X45_12770 [Lentisphaerae bacterium GWF2_50_93]HCE44209.1 hypothetical protein [Lentisphaeria bacterium]
MDFNYMYRFIQTQDISHAGCAYRLRYHVYCDEKKWLDAGGYPEGEEMDAYDGHSVIFLALDPEGNAVGTIRLIVKDDMISLPIGLNFNTGKQHFDNACEISRMAVPRNYRRGNVAIGLMRILFRHVLAHGDELEHVYISVEDRFLLALNLLGFEFIPIGPPAFCCGDVLVPSMLRAAELEPSLQRNNRRFYEWLMEDPHVMAAGKDNLLHVYTRTGDRKLAWKNGGA